MANLDELQIKITASSKEADEAIKTLTSSLNNLNEALGNLDTSKVNSFASAMSKLANIGVSTNATSRALKGMANELASSYGIRTKKGIQDITTALVGLYEAEKMTRKDSSPMTADMYLGSMDNLKQAIKDHYVFRNELDESTKKVLEFIDIQKKNGSKIGFKNFVKNYTPETFKEMNTALGGILDPKHTDAEEGYQKLDNFIKGIKNYSNADIDLSNPYNGIENVKQIVDDAAKSVWDFDKAFDEGEHKARGLEKAVYGVASAIAKFYTSQLQNGVGNGLGGIIEVFKQIGKIQMPDVSGVADAIKATQGAVKNVGNSAPNVEKVANAVESVGAAASKATSPVSNMANSVAKSMDKAESSVKVFRDSLNGLSNSKKVITGAAANLRNYEPEERGFISDVQATGLGKMLPAVIQTSEAFDDICRKAYEAAQATEKLKSETDGLANHNPYEQITEGAKKAASTIEEAISNAREFKKVISDMEGGKTAFNEDTYRNAVQGLSKANETIKNYKDNIDSSNAKTESVASGEVLENIVALGEAFEKLGSKLDAAGNKFIKLFKILTTPLKKATEEYAEKFKHMGEIVKGFQENFKAHMAKISQFWKRTMKTFTFMLVRKAITAIIKEVGNAVQSLAMYSNAMGTAFNTDISNMVADFQYLGRSIVSVFAPLLNYIAPIIDAIVARIATLLSYIGMLFAALGGKATFTKAKKNVGNYAESLDQASKSAKNLTMGIDELNILSESGGGGGAKPYDGWEDAWEDVDIPNWIEDMADWFKDLWDRFTAPLKEAWNRAKQYVIDGFKTMLDSLKRLFGHVLDDFLTMWNQEKTIRMFEEMFRIVGDIFRVVRNIADQLDKAWQKGKVGLHIFENIRDICKIIVDHVRNVSYYMIGWAKELNFTPFLESFELLTRKMKPLADFIGGLFEDAMIKGVLPYIKYLLEEALPHLQETIAEILDTFSFNALRDNIAPLWSAFEEMFERIHTGTTNAIGNLGKEIARFTNSKDFTDFLQRIVDITKLITAERVEKVLTGLGKGILAIAKAVIKFVNSKPFMAFLEGIAKWIDNHSVDQIAKILGNIANAILMFKFGAFAAEKLSGVFQFFTILKGLTNLRTIATELTGIGKALGVAAGGVETLVASGSKLSSITGILSSVATGIGAVFVAFEEFKHYSHAVEDIILALNGGDESLNGALLELVATVGIASAAFTLLLGFPAGLIAVGCVGAVAAIKGIVDAVEQIRMDNIFDSVLAQGDTTISQVKEWYGQATETIEENIEKWKYAERNLTQDRGDLEAYSRTLQELSEVFENTGAITAGMAETLAGKYEDMSKAVDNYINQSTDALVSNLLAQKAFLEAQGMDVDQMIVDIYRGAEEEKKAIDGSVEAVREAVDGLQDLTEGTEEYNAQMAKVKDATKEANTALEDYYNIINEVDTSEAVKEIAELGKSLDLSQYAGDWDAAAADIKNHIQDVTSAYTRNMEELKTESDRLKEEIDLMPNIPDEAKEAAKMSIDKAYDEASAELTSKTGEVFTFYADSLKTQMQGVATQAHADWETFNPLKKFWYGSEDKYVLTQMQTYVDNMLGQEGLAGAFSKGFEALPGAVDPHVVESMAALVDNQQRAFEESMFNNEAELKGAQNDIFKNVLNSVNELDFDTPASTFASKNYNAYQSHLQGVDYISLGRMWNAETGNALISESSIFEDSNRLAANEGAAAFSQEYRDFLTGNEDIVTTLSDTGTNYAGGLVEGMNEGIKAKMTETLPFLEDWMKVIDEGIHFNKIIPWGSPNQKTHEYGEDLVYGLNEGIDAARTSTGTPLQTWFAFIKGTLNVQLSQVKQLFNEKIAVLFSGEGADLSGAANKLFSSVTNVLINNINLLGDNLLNTILPSFMETYIFPFFNLEKWQPLFDNLMNVVFLPFFEQFRTWFMEEAMTPWWEEDLLFWFTAEKWNEEIFTPLQENIQENWDIFSSWWDTTMNEWWETQVVPWFEKTKWEPQFNNILEVAKKVFELIKEAIKKRINEAKEAVLDACEKMKNAIVEVMDAIDEMLDKLKDFEGFQGDVTFSFGGVNEYATGGFPAYGSLFIAGEPGAGTEWVGNVGGRTGVVSNDEITGIADAVYATGNAETELLGQLLTIGRAMLDKDPVVISDKDIARMANRGQSQLGMSIIS